MKKYPFASVVVCTRNRADILNSMALKSLSALDYPDFEVVVVDDASADNTQKVIESYRGKMRKLKNVKNREARGLCHARNLGVKNSKGEIIAFTDDDCIVHKNWLKEHVKEHVRNINAMAVGGKTFVNYTKNLFNNTKNEIFGCNMSFKNEVFDRFLFDTNVYFGRNIFYDETEMIIKLKKCGYKTSFCETAVVNHFMEGERVLQDPYNGVNGFYTFCKHIPAAKGYYFILKSAFEGVLRIFKIRINKEHAEAEHALYAICKPFLMKKSKKKFFHLPLIAFYLLIIPIKARLKAKKEGIC